MGGNDWNNKFSVFGLRIIHLRLWSSKNMQGIWPKNQKVPPVGHSWMQHSMCRFPVDTLPALTPACGLLSSIFIRSWDSMMANVTYRGTWPTMPQRSAAWVSLRQGIFTRHPQFLLKAMRFLRFTWLKWQKASDKDISIFRIYIFLKKGFKGNQFDLSFLLVVLVVLLVFLVL